ncbi:MAG: class I SAM-dependent methyltransferase [Desulfobacteraceae bacterium]|nr:class I SAM-dependent methyltransferase [Desulfobacteraceae bacterium]
MSHIHDHSQQPSPFLVENIDLLPKGRALDLAMGGGRNAVYLAKIGYETEGIDISRKEVGAALELARKSGVGLKTHIQDLEGNVHFDEASYDVIICFNYLHRPLIPKMKDALRTEGMIVYETYIVDQAQFGRPRNPNHLLERNELLNMFREFRCLRYREGIIENRKALAGIIAEKV